jgi:hypothetical protein
VKWDNSFLKKFFIRPSLEALKPGASLQFDLTR